MNVVRLIISGMLSLAIATMTRADDRAEAGDAAEKWAPKRDIPELREARQLILVLTPAWDSVPAELARYERSSAGAPWRPVSPATPVVVGRTGLAWGIGLHSEVPPGIRPKKEGDGKSPAGVFLLLESLGYAAASEPGKK